MGTPLPRVDPGAACDICWGIGKTFSTGDTPFRITMQIHDYIPGEHWVDADKQPLEIGHCLFQQPEPCMWQVVTPIYLFTWWFRLTHTEVHVAHRPSTYSAFHVITDEICALKVVSTQNDPSGLFAYGGWAEMGWALEF